MSFEEEHIDKSIKSKMDNLEIIPADSVWHNIEGSLLKNKRIAFRNKMVGVTAVFVTTLFIVWLCYHTNTKNGIERINSDSVRSQEFIEVDSNVLKETLLPAAIPIKSSVPQNEKKINPKSSNRFPQDSVAMVKERVAVIAVDSVPQESKPEEKVVVKKVIKKPVYVVQQDTIFKVDTLSKKKKR